MDIYKDMHFIQWYLFNNR